MNYVKSECFNFYSAYRNGFSYSQSLFVTTPQPWALLDGGAGVGGAGDAGGDALCAGGVRCLLGVTRRVLEAVESERCFGVSKFPLWRLPR